MSTKNNNSGNARKKLLTVLSYILIPLMILCGITYYASIQKQDKLEYYQLVALLLNIGRHLCSIIILFAQGNHVSKSHYCWIAICAFFFLILSLSSGLLGFGEVLVWIFYALFALGSFLLVVCPDPGTEKMIHDPFWGAVIYLVMVAVVYAIIWGIALSILINL